MIIDSHQHVFSNTQSQLDFMDKAGVDKTILFQQQCILKMQVIYYSLKLKWIS